MLDVRYCNKEIEISEIETNETFSLLKLFG